MSKVIHSIRIKDVEAVLGDEVEVSDIGSTYYGYKAVINVIESESRVRIKFTEIENWFLVFMPEQLRVTVHK